MAHGWGVGQLDYDPAACHELKICAKPVRADLVDANFSAFYVVPASDSSRSGPVQAE